MFLSDFKLVMLFSRNIIGKTEGNSPADIVRHFYVYCTVLNRNQNSQEVLTIQYIVLKIWDQQFWSSINYLSQSVTHYSHGAFIGQFCNVRCFGITNSIESNTCLQDSVTTIVCIGYRSYKIMFSLLCNGWHCNSIKHFKYDLLQYNYDKIFIKLRIDFSRHLS